jgi:LL-diaminopimelate aminotransferase
MSFFDDKIARRLGGDNFGKSTAIYKFERIKRSKAAARLAHPDVPLIDMGVGEPDAPADPLVVAALAREAGLRENRLYADNGIPEFKDAAARYLSRVYGVRGVDPETQILHGIGSKAILAMLPLCFIDPGDVILTTAPCYPIASSYARYLGGEVYGLPLRAENGFFPDFDAIPRDVLSRAKMLYINYPNNPTGAVATKEFFSRVVDFAQRSGIVVVHDAAYAALTYDGYEPLSFLSVDGAFDVGIEVHSLSKAFNMTGWRIGFACGNAKAIEAYATVKDNSDAGQFRAIQKAAALALDHPEITERTAEKYSRRFDLLVPALREIGFDASKPSGSFYCYVKAPVATAAGVKFATAADFSDFLLREALVSTVPWDDAGAYLRFSVTFEADSPERELAVVGEMKRRLLALDLVFDAR